MVTGMLPEKTRNRPPADAKHDPKLVKLVVTLVWLLGPWGSPENPRRGPEATKGMRTLFKTFEYSLWSPGPKINHSKNDFTLEGATPSIFEAY